MSDDEQEETCIAVPKLDIESSVEHERRLVVAPNGLSTITFYELPHPQCQTSALYQIDNERVCEVFSKSMEERSIFYNNSVISLAPLTLLSPIHPLFIVLPVIEKFKQNSFTLDQLVDQSAHPAFALLIRMNAAKNAIQRVSDSNDDHYTINDQKLNEWLRRRFDVLLKHITADRCSLDKVQDANLEATAFEIFCDYLTTKTASRLRDAWSIPAIATLDPETPTVKRPAAPASAKKNNATPSAKKRKLMESSKGTISLTTFFSR